MCRIFSEHLFLRTPLDGCFWTFRRRPYVRSIYVLCLHGQGAVPEIKNLLELRLRFFLIFPGLFQNNSLKNEIVLYLNLPSRHRTSSEHLMYVQFVSCVYWVFSAKLITAWKVAKVGDFSSSYLDTQWIANTPKLFLAYLNKYIILPVEVL